MVQCAVSGLYCRHASFVRRVLARFGVPQADRDDQLHEVFVVVHRRLDDYGGRGDMRSWLYGIARRVAASYRRKSYRTREVAFDDPYGDRPASTDPEREVELALARERYAAILGQMTRTQRDTFVRFDVAGLTGRSIAEDEGCPLPTVFSRLLRARACYDAEVRKLRLVDSGAFARPSGSPSGIPVT